MEFRILGPLDVEGAAGQIQLGGGKQRALLALLLLQANEVVPTARLIDALWPDEPPVDAAKALQVHVSRLRRALGPDDVVQTRPGGYSLAVDPGRFDLPRFQAQAARARSLLEAGEPAAAREAYGKALELWRGAPLADLVSEPFARPEIDRLEELFLAATEGRIDAGLALGRHDAVAGELEALVAKHPLRERLRAQLMLALYRSGRQAESLAAYRDAREALVDELGIDPGRPLQELEQAILRQDPSLDLRTAPAATPAVRPGRRAAGLFVGRERELDELGSALEDAAAGRGRFFLVSGDSGTGKTRRADELASRAKDGGLRVFWARCPKRPGAPVYWPWTQALGSILPELDPAADDAERFRLFVAASSALRDASREQPLLLVLDDLHAADDLSLLLLEFVAGDLAEQHVAVLGTYVDDGAVPEALAALADHTAHHQLRLAPLDVDEVAQFIALSGSEALDAAVVHAETGGNPRLVWQRVR